MVGNGETSSGSFASSNIAVRVSPGYVIGVVLSVDQESRGPNAEKDHDAAD